MAEEKTSTKGKIMDAGRDLFWKHGFRRVSIDDICNGAGISKMTFYRYFPNKTELAKAVYDRVLAEGYVKFRTIMNDDSSPEEKIHQFLLLKMEGTNELSQDFVTDFYSSKETGLKEYVQVKISGMWKDIMGDIRQAQEKGIFRKDFNPEMFYFAWQKFTDILEDKNIQRLYDNTQDMVMDLIKLLTYGIAPNK
jgi:AcrR family transcriptional regulator